MIAVTGEALIDLVIDPDGHVAARPGGGPFNTARTIGRLGLAPAFLGRLSRDSFGRLLHASLDSDGVALAVPQLTEAPTTLAAVDVDESGAARYSFYLAGTSSSALEYRLLAAALPPGLTALHAGSLALVMEPIATATERLIARDVPPATLVMVDPNCRPEAIADRDAYRGRLLRILRRADVVKVSTEDLGYLFPGVPPHSAANALLERGPCLVLLTDGARPAWAFLPGEELSVQVPPVQVIDTIGAGDAFGGAFLAWWSANNLGQLALRDGEAVRDAVEAAAEVASLTCARVGAEPPWLAEVAGPRWPSHCQPQAKQSLT
jgi:fructokinase